MSDNWHLVAKSLSDKYKVVVCDARNHGQSPHSDEMSFRLMAEDVIELADDLGIEKFALLGHSMGGKTAFVLSELFPERLTHLVIADIAPKAYKPGHLTYFKAFREINWSSFNSRKEIDEALSKYESIAGIRLFLAKNIERNENGNGYAVKSNMEALERTYPEIIGPLELEGKYQGKMLIMAGENSRYVNEDDLRELKGQYPLLQYEVVSKAGHWLHADNPSEFIERLSVFLAQ